MPDKADKAERAAEKAFDAGTAEINAEADRVTALAQDPEVIAVISLPLTDQQIADRAAARARLTKAVVNLEAALEKQRHPEQRGTETVVSK